MLIKITKYNTTVSIEDEIIYLYISILKKSNKTMDIIKARNDIREIYDDIKIHAHSTIPRNFSLEVTKQLCKNMASAVYLLPNTDDIYIHL